MYGRDGHSLVIAGPVHRYRSEAERCDANGNPIGPSNGAQTLSEGARTHLATVLRERMDPSDGPGKVVHLDDLRGDPSRGTQIKRALLLADHDAARPSIVDSGSRI